MLQKHSRFVVLILKFDNTCFHTGSQDVNLKKEAGKSVLRAVRPVGSSTWMETNDTVAADIYVEIERKFSDFIYLKNLDVGTAAQYSSI